MIEISETCALSAAGCFSGDVAGFPVTIAQSGSYRLTSNLRVPDENTTAIQVTALNVSIDLGGFTISGPTVCGPGLPVTNCSPTGSGIGLLGGGQVTVRNGVITGMGGDGINLAYAARVEDVRAISNGGDGVHAQNGAIVRGVEAAANGGDGIDTGIETLLRSNLAYGNKVYGVDALGGNVMENVVSRNGSLGARLGAATAFHGNQFIDNGASEVDGGRAIGGNACSDHTCTRTGARRFYVTFASPTGSQAPAGCVPGFHMASIWEIYETSALVYDTTFGLTTDDSGSGPPSYVQGWFRTGYQSLGAPSLGFSNCLGYSSSAPGDYGSVMHLRVDPTGFGAFWEVGLSACNQPHRVWCAED